MTTSATSGDCQRQKNKSARGAGIYYHLSYYGPPEDYLWLESTPPALVWEEMSRAYDRGARNIWVVNVGDIKPAEKGITFFLNLAWNPKQYDENCQLAFLKEFAGRSFGAEFSEEIGSIWDEYYRLNFYPRPEHSLYGNFPWAHSQQRLDRFAKLIARTNALYERVPPELKNACYELLVYPVRRSAAMNEKQLCAARWRELRMINDPSAETFHSRSLAAQKEMDSETLYCNENLADGKWKLIISDKQRNEHPFREPELTLQKPKEMADVQLDPPVEAATIIPAAHARTTDSSRLTWKTIHGLGSTGDCITALAKLSADNQDDLWPAIPDDATPGELSKLLPSLRFNISVAASENSTIAVDCLPTHAVNDHRHLRYAMSIDNQPATIIDIDSLEFSLQWKRNVLRNLVSCPGKAISPGSHTLTLWPLDPAIVFDRIIVASGHS